jgi:HlyD family secretion protein
MPNKSKTRWFKWLVLIILLAAGGSWAYKNFQKPVVEAPKFQATVIGRGDLVQMVTAAGALNPVTNVQVGSQISGQILKINVDFNSKVKAGDIVAEIDPATYRTRLLQNEADLASARASLQLAEVNARRAEELFKNKLISQAEYDTTIANLTQAQAQVQTREAQVNSTKVDLARCTIYAPIDGIVIDRKVDVGQTVAASLNAPLLFMIANDLTKMQINASVAEADIGSVEVGQDVKFSVDAFPGRDFTGKVIQVRNAAQMVQNVVSYDTIIEVENLDGKLKPGMTANVQILTAQKKGVIRVPNSALRFRPPEAFMAMRKAPAGGAAVAAAGDAPDTPEAVIQKVKEYRDRGEQIPDSLREKMGEMMRTGKITAEQLGMKGGPPGGGSGFSGGRSRSSSGGSGGPGGSSGGSRSRGGGRAGGGDRSVVRTVYVSNVGTNIANITPDDLKAVTVKVGISDGIYTEITEGLNDGDVILSGVALSSSASAANRPTNPFATSFRRGP